MHEDSHFPISLPALGIIFLTFVRLWVKPCCVGVDSWELTEHTSSQFLVPRPHTGNLKSVGGESTHTVETGKHNQDPPLFPQFFLKNIYQHTIGSIKLSFHSLITREFEHHFYVGLPFGVPFSKLLFLPFSPFILDFFFSFLLTF